ncbi:unnamed protein product [Chrysoparadoxa australica]
MMNLLLLLVVVVSVAVVESSKSLSLNFIRISDWAPACPDSTGYEHRKTAAMTLEIGDGVIWGSFDSVAGVPVTWLQGNYPQDEAPGCDFTMENTREWNKVVAEVSLLGTVDGDSKELHLNYRALGAPSCSVTYELETFLPGDLTLSSIIGCTAY